MIIEDAQKEYFDVATYNLHFINDDRCEFK